MRSATSPTTIRSQDIADRVGRAKAMSETVILGGTGGHPGAR